MTNTNKFVSGLPLKPEERQRQLSLEEILRDAQQAIYRKKMAKLKPFFAITHRITGERDD